MCKVYILGLGSVRGLEVTLYVPLPTTGSRSARWTVKDPKLQALLRENFTEICMLMTERSGATEADE